MDRGRAGSQGRGWNAGVAVAGGGGRVGVEVGLVKVVRHCVVIGRSTWWAADLPACLPACLLACPPAGRCCRCLALPAAGGLWCREGRAAGI